MKYKLIVSEIPGYIEIEAKNETDAVLRAKLAGMTVRTIMSVDDSKSPESVEDQISISKKKLIEIASNMVGYLKELKEHDTPEEQVEFWENMGMNRELMDYFDVLCEKQDTEESF